MKQKEIHPYDYMDSFEKFACQIPTKVFVGLRSKMYSYLIDNNYNGKTAKCIKKTQ